VSVQKNIWKGREADEGGPEAMGRKALRFLSWGKENERGVKAQRARKKTRDSERERTGRDY